jgi:hypothetical protein
MQIQPRSVDHLNIHGSLVNTADSYSFEIENRQLDVEFVGLRNVAIDGAPVELEDIVPIPNSATTIAPALSAAHFIVVLLRAATFMTIKVDLLERGGQRIEIAFHVEPHAEISFATDEYIAAPGEVDRILVIPVITKTTKS